jgi:hypothetical protein
MEGGLRDQLGSLDWRLRLARVIEIRKRECGVGMETAARGAKPVRGEREGRKERVRGGRGKDGRRGGG